MAAALTLFVGILIRNGFDLSLENHFAVQPAFSKVVLRWQSTSGTRLDRALIPSAVTCEALRKFNKAVKNR
jgi:hypothetical protein